MGFGFCNLLLYIYVALIIIGVILFFYLGSSLIINGKQVIKPKIDDALGIILLFLYIIVVALVCNLIANKKMEKIGAIMTRECNFQEYIDICSKLLNENNSNLNRTFLLLMLSNGYLAIGNNLAAKQTLDSINYFIDNSDGIANKIWYFNNLAAYYLQTNNVEMVSDTLNYMQIALDDKKLKVRLRNDLFSLYTEKCFLLNIEKDNYDGAEQLFNIKFQREKEALGKVSAKFTLGRIYLHFGRISEAKDSFEYVICNGGKSYYVEKTNILLNQLS